MDCQEQKHIELLQKTEKVKHHRYIQVYINNNIIKSYLYVRNLHKDSFFNCILSEDKEIFMYNGKK